MITTEELKTILLKGDLAVLKIALKNYNINECDKFGNTALHLAVIGQQYEAFSYLIEKGANVNAQDIHGNSVLSVAVFNYKKNPPLYREMIETLLKYNANPHLANQYNVTVHSLAHSIGNADVKKFF